MAPPHGIDAVSALDKGAFVVLLGGVAEASPWVAEGAWEQRPFTDVSSLHAALVATIDAAPAAQQLALIRAHPDLAGKAEIAKIARLRPEDLVADKGPQ
jgi:2-oxo-4-hydroxy-4-carboxy-5-ureidoimidazoline decarboxylase